MSGKSIFYKFPLLYIWGLKWIHKSNFSKRYQYISSVARGGDLVLEPGCGPAILADFLPQDSSYKGFDANQDFVNHARKRHPGVYLGDVLDLNDYCKAEVVAVCDVLHHLDPVDRKKFIQNCYRSADDTFIICDPGKKVNHGSNLFYPIWKRLTEWSEKDGTNNFKCEHFLTRDQLVDEIDNGFGIIPSSVKREVKEIGDDIVAIFFKNEEIWREMSNRKSVSAIVPVFNEEKTISKVVSALLKNNLIDEVICINDGSTDTSMDVLNQYKGKIEIIDLQKNYGKGFALSVGIKKAKGEIVAFIDADLTNLSDDHIRELLTPLLTNSARGVVGYPSSVKGSLLNPLSNFAGERAYYKKDLISHVEEMAKTRFGVEVFLNYLFDKKEIKKVPLKKLKGLFKHEKRRPSNTLAEYHGELSEVIKEVLRQKGFSKAKEESIN